MPFHHTGILETLQLDLIPNRSFTKLIPNEKLAALSLF